MSQSSNNSSSIQDSSSNFTYLINAQVRQVISNLSKKNLKASKDELKNLILMYGDECRIVIFRTILETIDFRDQKNQQKDQLRIQLFQHELVEVSRLPNFHSILLQSFENQQFNSEDGFVQFCKSMKFQLSHELIICLSLAYSNDLQISQEALKSLKVKIIELNSNPTSIDNLSPNFIQRLIIFCRSNDSFDQTLLTTLSNALSQSKHSTLLKSNSPILLALENESSFIGDSWENSTSNQETESLKSKLNETSRIADLMKDIGYACLSTPSQFSSLLARFPPLNEEQVARIIGMLCTTRIGLEENQESDISSDLKTWDINVFLQVLREKYPSLNWRFILQNLDYSDLIFHDIEDFTFLMLIYESATKQLLPVSFLFCDWKNRSTQLSFFKMLTNIAVERLDYGGTTQVILHETSHPIPTKNLMNSPLQSCWLCLNLIDILVRIGDLGFDVEVREILENPIQNCPEILLLGLVQLPTTNSALREVLIDELLPIFIATHPNSSFVIHRVWATDRNVLVRGFLNVYSEDKNLLSRILDISQDLKALSTVLECKNYPFTIDLAALASRREYLNLEKWLQDRIEEFKEPFIRAAVAYLIEKNLQHQQQLQSPQPVQKETKAQSNAQLPVKILSTFVSCLHSKANLIPVDLRDELNRVKIASQFRPEIEEQANAYFQKIYTYQVSIEEAINFLKHLKASQVAKDNEIFKCMIHNLFDEYKFFPKYPERELRLTAILFGQLIQHNMLTINFLGAALSYVIEALRKVPSSKMFKFGLLALDQFKNRLVEWPHYCTQLLQILHLREFNPEIATFIERAYSIGANTNANLQKPQSTTPQQSQQQQPSTAAALSQHLHSATSAPIPNVPMTPLSMQQPTQPQPTTINSPMTSLATNLSQILMSSPGQISIPVQHPIAQHPHSIQQHSIQQPIPIHKEPEQLQQQQQPTIPIQRVQQPATTTNPYQTQSQSIKSIPKPPPSAPAATISTSTMNIRREVDDGLTADDRVILGTSIPVDTLIKNTNRMTIVPSENIQNKVHFIFNNLSAQNILLKRRELEDMLIPDFYPWLGNYIVVKRATLEPSFHQLYLSIIEKMHPRVVVEVLSSTYMNIRVLVKSDKITTNNNERTLLKNLGTWLGYLTLARSKPILHRDLDIRELLLTAYEQGKLIAAVPFISKVLENCLHSKIFSPPNVWLMSVIRLLCEIYKVPNLKLNIKFEIELLCKNLQLNMNDITPTNYLRTRKTPPIAGQNPDLGKIISSSATDLPTTTIITSASPSTLIESSNSTPLPLNPLLIDKSVSNPSLPSIPPPIITSSSSNQENAATQFAKMIVIQPTIALFNQQPNLKNSVVPAIERAIRELIGPVVERSVTIACTTATQLVLKDFVFDADETKLQKAAHLTVQTLASSLSTVTCKELLRVSILTNLRTAFSQTNQNQNQPQQQPSPQLQTLIDEAIQIICLDNLDIACKCIEKAAIEKSLIQIDESIKSSIQLRRTYRERTVNQPFYDHQIYKPIPAVVPDVLKPKLGGLTTQQMKIYEDFSKLPKLLSIGSPKSSVEANPNLLESDQSKSLSLGGTTSTQSNTNQSNQSNSMNDSQKIPTRQEKMHEQPIIEKFKLAINEINDLLLNGPNSTNEIQLVINQLKSTILQYRSIEFGQLIVQKTFKLLFIYSDQQHLSVFLSMIEDFREKFQVNGLKFVEWFTKYARNDLKRNCDVIELIFNRKWINAIDFDSCVARLMNTTSNEAVEHLLQWIRHLEDKIDLVQTNEAHKQRLAARLGVQSAETTVNQKKQLSEKEKIDFHDQVIQLFEEWLKITNEIGITNLTNNQQQQSKVNYIIKLQQLGILKGDELPVKFFAICTEYCIESARNPDQDGLYYQSIDAFSKLVVLLVKYYFSDGSPTAKANLLNLILAVLSRSLQRDHELRKADFNQRPYHRLLNAWLTEFLAPDPVLDPISQQILISFSNLFLSIQPQKVSGFSMAWMELISHRVFMPKLLISKGQKTWQLFQRLFIELLKFLEPFLRTAELTESLRILYKGTLRILLVLLHDFPEFLCEYHFSFCDVIPTTCIQMRNLILSAFPRSMRLPDPFTPNLKVDLLPEINQFPRILSNYTLAIQNAGLSQDLENYLRLRAPVSFLVELKQKLLLNAQEIQQTGGIRYNISLINSIVMTIGIHSIQLQTKQQQQQQSNQQPSAPPLAHGAAMDIFQQLAVDLDTEGRYYLINAIANQLRYPNNQTYYFSYVLLHLFSDISISGQSIIQEQITRVLLERLIVNRPHPWGLLITFIELIKNPRYNFWNYGFTRCAPEIERVFESVARSCIHPSKPDENQS